MYPKAIETNIEMKQQNEPVKLLQQLSYIYIYTQYAQGFKEKHKQKQRNGKYLKELNGISRDESYK